MIETVIMDDILVLDLGNVQAAYDGHAELAATRKTAAENYKASVEQLQDKDLAAISPKDKEQVNSLYEIFEKAAQDLQDGEAVLDRKFEELAMKAKELTGDLAHLQSENTGNDNDLDWAKEILAQGFTLREQNITEAIEKAYQAHDCMLRLKTEQNNTWLGKHVQRVEIIE
jgi:hypothetical protein